MKEVFVVMFTVVSNGSSYADSVFVSEEKALKYCQEQNEWERSEHGSGDLWHYVKCEYHAE